MLGRVTACMRFLLFGTIPLDALLAGDLGTALGTRNGLWIVLILFALSGTFLLTPAIAARRDLPWPDVPKGSQGAQGVPGGV
jgi:hypothetical protein